MANKTLKTRIINKHDTQANWAKAKNFIPKAGEVIVYTDLHKVKVGDGTTTVSALPFIDNDKVDKVSGKQLSTNDYTTTEKNKLAGIENGAQKNAVTSVAGKTGAVTLSIDDIANLSSTIPTVNNATITIQQNGTTKGTFTLNQSGDTTISLTDNNTTYTAGTGLTLSNNSFSVKTDYSTNGKNYAVQTDGNNSLYVNVPWTDNNTTYSTATSSILGLVKSSTTGTTSGRDYKVQVNSDGTMKVNVPWTDTKYTLPSDVVHDSDLDTYATFNDLHTLDIGAITSSSNIYQTLYQNVYENDTTKKNVVIFSTEGFVDSATSLISSGDHIATPYQDNKISIDSVFVLNSDNSATSIVSSDTVIIDSLIVDFGENILSGTFTQDELTKYLNAFNSNSTTIIHGGANNYFYPVQLDDTTSYTYIGSDYYGHLVTIGIDAATGNYYVIEQVNDKQDKTLSTPITVNGVSKTTVESALSAINELAENGGTGVSALEERVSAVELKNTNQDNLISAAQSKADSAYSLAEGRSSGYVFDDFTSLKTTLKAAPLAGTGSYKIGDNLFIKATDTPDYWISGKLTTNTGTYGYYEITELETAKVDLSGYQTKEDSSLQTPNNTTVVGAINYLNGVYASHIGNKNNPHGVTKAQVGLGNVANTGDSATPVSGGTTKFTTGGAYTELNKKVDKVSGKGLSTNDLTNDLKSSYDSAAANSHTHSNKTTLDAITSDVKSGYDNVVTKVNNFTGGIVTISSSALSETMTLSSTELTNIKNAIRHATSNTQFVSNIRFNFVNGTNVSIDFSISDYFASNNTHYLLLTGHYIDTSKIYKVYLGFTYANDTLTHNAIRIEEYGTF